MTPAVPVIDDSSSWSAQLLSYAFAVIVDNSRPIGALRVRGPIGEPVCLDYIAPARLQVRARPTSQVSAHASGVAAPHLTAASDAALLGLLGLNTSDGKSPKAAHRTHAVPLRGATTFHVTCRVAILFVFVVGVLVVVMLLLLLPLSLPVCHLGTADLRRRWVQPGTLLAKPGYGLPT